MFDRLKTLVRSWLDEPASARERVSADDGVVSPTTSPNRLPTGHRGSHVTTTELLVSARAPRHEDAARSRADRTRAVADEYLRRRQRRLRAQLESRRVTSTAGSRS